MSKIEVDTIEPQSGTSLTLGASGDTITIPSGGTLGGAGTFDLTSGSVTLNDTMKNTPLFKVRLASAQAIATTTRTVIAFDQVEIDTGSNWDNTNKRYIPDEAGYYFFYTQVRLADSSDFSDFGLRLRKNGNASSDYVESNVSNWHYESNWCQGIWYMNGTTDYVDVTAYHNKGSNSEINAPWYTWIQGFKLIGS